MRKEIVTAQPTFKFGFVGGFAHVVGEGLAPPEICKNIR
jgi:hypothetical protein